jgi:hypothetical protein
MPIQKVESLSTGVLTSGYYTVHTSSEREIKIEIDKAAVAAQFANSLVEALAVNCSTTDLLLGREGLRDNFMEALVGGLSGNQGLRSLEMSEVGEALWKCFWSAVPRYPTIQKVNFSRWAVDSRDREDCTRCKAQSIRTDTVLTHIEYGAGFSENDLDGEIMKSSVMPILELNLFRARFVALHQVVSESARRRFILPTLLRAGHAPDLCFHFFREHSSNISAFDPPVTYSNSQVREASAGAGAWKALTRDSKASDAMWPFST